MSAPSLFELYENNYRSGQITARRSSLTHRYATQDVDASSLPRSAGYTYCPPIKDIIYEESPIIRLKGTISVCDFASSNEDDDTSIYDHSGSTSPDNEPATPPEPAHILPTGLKLFTASAGLLHKVTEPRAVVIARHDTPFEGEERQAFEHPRQSARSRRPSWMTPSRSPSPRKPAPAVIMTEDQPLYMAGRPASAAPVKRETEGLDSSSRSSSPVSGLRRVLTKKPKRPAIAALPSSGPVEVHVPSGAPPLPVSSHIPKSFSLDRLTSLNGSMSSFASSRPSLAAVGNDSPRKSKSEIGRKRDELWTAFRTLEGEFQKYVRSHCCSRSC